MSDEIPRFYADLININERERDIIIGWAEAIIDEWGGLPDEQKVLFKRFTDWRDQRERDKRGDDA